MANPPPLASLELEVLAVSPPFRCYTICCRPAVADNVSTCRQARRTLLELLGYDPLDLPPGEAGYGAGSRAPHVMFGFLKHLWHTGDRHDALNRSSTLPEGHQGLSTQPCCHSAAFSAQNGPHAASALQGLTELMGSMSGLCYCKMRVQSIPAPARASNMSFLPKPAWTGPGRPEHLSHEVQA